MKYINYSKELKKVVLPRYQELKSEKTTGFIRTSSGDSKIKVTYKEEKKKAETKVEEIEERSL